MKRILIVMIVLLAMPVIAWDNEFCAFTGEIRDGDGTPIGPGIQVDLTLGDFTKTDTTDPKSRYAIPITVLVDGRGCDDDEPVTVKVFHPTTRRSTAVMTNVAEGGTTIEHAAIDFVGTMIRMHTPQDGEIINGSVLFTCSVLSDMPITNLILYTDVDGWGPKLEAPGRTASWKVDDLPPGKHVWACAATDGETTLFAEQKYTLTIPGPEKEVPLNILLYVISLFTVFIILNILFWVVAHRKKRQFELLILTALAMFIILAAIMLLLMRYF